MLTLVAPSSMTADQQTLWLASAVDALDGIRASEVQKVSAEIRRSITRHNQLVPAVCEAVAELRKERSAQARRQLECERDLLPPPKKHIADRDRRYFTASDWAELNEHLQRMGSTVRYGSNGERMAA